MFFEDGLNNGSFGKLLTRLWPVLAFGPEIVDVEAQDIAIFDGVRDGVGV